MIPAVSQEDTLAAPSFVNTIAISILRSPLHGWLHHNTLLLSFQGRKSGKTYTIPLSYTQEGDTVLCFTRRGNTWWKNLREDTPVTVDLKGWSLPGKASAGGSSPLRTINLANDTTPRYKSLHPWNAASKMWSSFSQASTEMKARALLTIITWLQMGLELSCCWL